MIATRWSGVGDAEAIARVFAASWRFAYSGVIPGGEIERRVAANGPLRWRRRRLRGMAARIVELDGRVFGFATLGPSRTRDRAPGGEIYELYVDPEGHGAGFGRRLFADARAVLKRRGLDGLVVWSLAENDVGCQFYRSLKGEERGRSSIRLGDATLEQIAFVWP